MVEAALERRVDTLEAYMKELSCQSIRTEMELAQLARELRGLKNEMCGFKDGPRAVKDEMRELRDEAERDRKYMGKKRGELSNRLGTLAEDILAPSLPRIARDLLGCAASRHAARPASG